MKRVFALTAVSALMLGGCSFSLGGSDDPSASPSATSASAPTSPTASPSGSASASGSAVAAGSLPYLPPLKPVQDPGNIDPLLGSFPVDSGRAYQYAWVEYAPKGREMVQSAINYDPALGEFKESDVYYAGAVSCVEVLSNLLVSDLQDYLASFFGDDQAAAADTTIDEAVITAAVEVMCPQGEPVLENVDYLVDTPLMLRTIIGVSDSDFSDEQANTFANAVCAELDRGTTQARLATQIADEYDYPDQTASFLVEQIDTVVCS